MWVLMITTAIDPGWPGDISLAEDHARYGLPRPGIVRTEKLSTVAFDGAGLFGALHGPKLELAIDRLHSYISANPPRAPAPRY